MPEISWKDFPALLVKRGTPAEVALRRIANHVQPGSIHFVTDVELASLQKDVIAVKVEA